MGFFPSANRFYNGWKMIKKNISNCKWISMWK